ncbi:MAG: NAD(P)/FAD-dependent oxidoreductase, partial [Calditrichaceae bacterium]
RGLSGPAILQISSYWNPGDSICLNLVPDIDFPELLMKHRSKKQKVENFLSLYLPKRMSRIFCLYHGFSGWINEYSEQELNKLANIVSCWEIKPNGTEGYRTAEVTRGGVDTNELSSRTMESKKIPGLYFIGEVVDVTGHLGGFNFQWAWASGYAAGQYV